MSMFKRIAAVGFLIACMIGAGHASPHDFESWLAAMRDDARQQGISERTVDSVLAQASFLPRVIDLDRKQPEGKMTFQQYREKIVNPARIKKGRAMMREHRALLEDVSAAYNVPPQYIVALWGIETNFGENTGGFSVISALATLAYEGRRGEFFKSELLHALKIIDEGHIAGAKMKGSWAGAMGQNQFMPSSFKRFAVDYDKDGRKDIWGTHADVFASSANYLSKSGWRGDERWGRAVKLPKGFAASSLGLEKTHTLESLRKAGVKTADGAALPQGDLRASVIAPDGPGGSAFLVYNNYRTIMKWNKSVYFATSVGLLADAISR